LTRSPKRPFIVPILPPAILRLQQRFAPLLSRLQSAVDMPADFGVEEFIASWDERQ